MDGWRWRSCAEDFDWRDWDGDVVVRSRVTGDTHSLDPLSSSVWLTLLNLGGAVTSAQLLQAWTDERDPAPSEDELTALGNVLTELHKRGLVVRES
jgi:PqqD family protein of HPr-rel-A system